MTQMERAKILHEKLRHEQFVAAMSKGDYGRELDLLVDALVDAASEAAEKAVTATREACASMVEGRADGATGLAREVFVGVAQDIRLLWK